ncbi:MAG TPA: hypothetical protein VF666_09305 [Pyrinomonadaceae bacterium]|jgi:hypothetical protein
MEEVCLVCKAKLTGKQKSSARAYAKMLSRTTNFRITRLNNSVAVKEGNRWFNRKVVAANGGLQSQ